jgi:purine-cytosine permease-like protein
MSAAWFVVLLILAIWGVGVTALTIADWLVRRRYSEQLEVRDWTEKVNAMKRLQDREGDA